MKQEFDSCGGFFADYIKNDRIYNMKEQHYHDGYEVYLQLDGRRYLFLDDICYDIKRGDMVFLRPLEIHHMESRDSVFYERYVINFRADSLSVVLSPEEVNMLLGTLKSCVVHLDDERLEQVSRYFADAYAAKHGGGFLAEKIMCFSAVRIAAIVRELSAVQELSAGRSIERAVLDTIHYINSSYNEELNLDIIAEEVHMSKYHLCRLFHEATGATVIEYLSNVRLTKVHKLLLDSKLSLAQIAAKTGFASTARMTYTFRRRYGMSPSEFRRKNR